MDTLLQDLRFALRILMKSPGVTVIAVLCIALGIGANTTIFSVVNAILLRPLPFAGPERIVVLYETQLRQNVDEAGFSYLDYRDLRQQARSFSETAAHVTRSLTFSGTDEPERVLGEAVSASLFPLLGEKPALGRTFLPDEDRPGAAPVVLLSHALWQRRYNSDPQILGRTVMVNAVAHTVVGVMKPLFRFPYQQEAWVPMAPLFHKDTRIDRNFSVMARLAPGATHEQARAEMETFARRLAKEYPDSHAGWGVRLLPLREEFLEEEVKLIVLTMMGAVACVLLIACANVANLFLARATARQREIAVRIAFGAKSGHILRQLLTESVVVGLLGGVLGILLGIWGIRLMTAAIPVENAPPYWIQFTVDGNVLLFTLLIAVATGLLFGLAPALQAAKTDINETLKEGGRGAGGSVRRNRLRSALVVAEVALSLVLLVGASLFVRSFLQLQTASGGFDTANLLTLRFYLPSGVYADGDEAAMARRVEDIVRRVEALPGVASATVSNTIPLSGGGDYGSILIEGQAFAPGEEPGVFFTGVTPHFFRTLNIAPRTGRMLTDREGMERSALAVVNQTFVQRFWPESPEGSAIGRRFHLKNGDKTEWLTIVGVVPDFKNGDMDDDTDPSAYLPYPYLVARSNGLTVRTELEPTQATAMVREEIRASDPNLPLYDIFTMEQVREQGFWEHRFFGQMFSAFGVIALFLAAIGVYGVLSYSVSQRWREIGVRVALGAQRRDVVRLVVGQGVGLALAGVGFGLLGAFGVTRVVSSILYNVSATDPVSFGGISLLLTGVAWLASYVPASRAMAVDPLEALRE